MNKEAAMKINRRNFLKQCALAAGASVFGCSAIAKDESVKSGSTDSRTDKPNIVFIMSDDHAFQAISAYHSQFIQTPNIDRIADREWYALMA